MKLKFYDKKTMDISFSPELEAFIHHWFNKGRHSEMTIQDVLEMIDDKDSALYMEANLARKMFGEFVITTND